MRVRRVLFSESSLRRCPLSKDLKQEGDIKRCVRSVPGSRSKAWRANLVNSKPSWILMSLSYLGAKAMFY